MFETLLVLSWPLIRSTNREDKSSCVFYLLSDKPNGISKLNRYGRNSSKGMCNCYESYSPVNHSHFYVVLLYCSYDYTCYLCFELHEKWSCWSVYCALYDFTSASCKCNKMVACMTLVVMVYDTSLLLLLPSSLSSCYSLMTIWSLTLFALLLLSLLSRWCHLSRRDGCNFL